MEDVEYLGAELTNRGFGAKVVNDSGWSDGAKGGRCITDYSREVVFSRELTTEELVEVKKIMAEKHCPGWTGVNGYCVNKETLLYRFSTTWDSSD